MLQFGAESHLHRSVFCGPTVEKPDDILDDIPEVGDRLPVVLVGGQCMPLGYFLDEVGLGLFASSDKRRAVLMLLYSILRRSGR